MSAASMSIRNFNSTLKREKEPQLTIPLPPPLPPSKGGKGIVSILGSDSEKRNKAAASIRRTLSADMSSKKWLSQNGLSQNAFPPMKKISSSKELAVLGQDDVWTSIQNGNKADQPTSLDVWSSILTQKKDDSSTVLPPPYVHPLLKKSSSSLTEKSLEICTESLGSETGSEISLPSYPSSDTDEDNDDPQNQKQQQEKEEIISQSFEEFPVVKFNHNKKKPSPPKSFPPPISSLAAEDKPSVQMQSHRQNGRLILEAVSVPPQNHFSAQRVDGRLVLTLITTTTEPETEENHQEVAEFEKVFDEIQEVEHNGPPHLGHDDDDDDEVDQEEGKGNGTKGMQIVLEQKPRMSNGRMNVNTSTLMMKQLMGLEKNNHHLTWPNKFNKAIKLIEDEDEITPIPITSPNPSPASFNAYDYFWKKNPTVTTIVNNYNDKSAAPIANGTTTKIAANYEQQDLVLMRGNKGNINYLMPLLSGCKEQRRSLLIWEPYCIATS